MLTKFLIAEAVLICGMLAAFAHRQLPATTLTLGENTVVIKEAGSDAAAPDFPIENPAEVVPELSPQAPTPVRSASGLVFPVAGFGPSAVISVFGDPRGTSRTHDGIDIKAPRGTEVVAVTEGFVERIREGGSGGKQVYLRDARGRLFYYAHLDEFRVREYDAVQPGDPLGTVGDTGNARSTTPHLHFEILLGKDRTAVDPLPFWRGA